MCLGGSLVIEGEELSVEAALARGLECHQRGAWDEARAIYRAVLRHDPSDGESLHLLGLLSHQTGDATQAIALIEAAVARLPDAAHFRCNLANALRAVGRGDAALAQYRQAQRLRPNSAEIRANLGTALLDLGHVDDAIACYRAACALQPENAVFHYNLASALAGRGSDEAETPFRECLRLSEDFPGASYNFAKFLLRRNRLEEAEIRYRDALRQNPDFSGAWNDLGVLLQRRDRLAEAARCHARAVALTPDDPDAHYNAGCAAMGRNDPDAAEASYRRALALAPDHAAARFALCMAKLPILYHDEGEIARRRRDYAAALEHLAQDAADEKVRRALAPGVGASPPFFLAYQGRDDRALQARHGDLVCRIMAEAVPPAPMRPRPRPGEPLKVGFVSGFFCEHTIWSLMLRGWLENLDRDRFRLFGYHTGARHDSSTELARAFCARFTHGPKAEAAWRAEILADAPHVLIYPEIGMDPGAARLAAQRLAPVQCVSWGHPVTSGMPTIDFFLTGDAMERADADTDYSEHLIRLPGLGIHYEPPSAGPATRSRASLGLRDTATVFWSGQALYKYLPQHDTVFPRIAREVGDCQFVFIAFARAEEVTSLFRRRLARAFAAYGLDADHHCVILPPLTPEDFIAAIRACDIVLDTIGWSGGKSTLEAFSQNPAIVTCPGPLMRGRHTAAMLELIDARDTIAESVDGYVAIAARLAHDTAWRSAVRARVAANKHRLFRDAAAISGLDAFLASAGKGIARNPTWRRS